MQTITYFGGICYQMKGSPIEIIKLLETTAFAFRGKVSKVIKIETETDREQKRLTMTTQEE